MDAASMIINNASTQVQYEELDPSSKQTIFCYRAIMTTSAGIWLHDNPLNFSFPLLLYQIILVFVTTRVVHSLLRRLSQPQVISQIIGGMILGPTIMGHNMNFEKLLYSAKSWEQLNTISMLSYTLFLFLIGVKTDIGMIRKAGKKAAAIAFVGTLASCASAVAVSYLLRRCKLPLDVNRTDLIVIVASRWSLTSYTVLACTLSELNLLTSKLGRLAMSASLLADFANLIVAAGITAYMIGSEQHNAVMSASSFVSFLGFIGFIVFVARPVTVWIIKRTPEGRLMDEASFVAVIFMALLCGLISEMIGFHMSVGPFMYGLVLPGGAPLGVTLVEKMERLVVGVFLPMYVAQAGQRMDLTRLMHHDVALWSYTLLLMVVSSAGKFLGCIGVCIYCKMSPRDALSLALIMLQKGIVEVDAISFYLDARVINHQVYITFILAILVFGGSTAPLIKYIYRPEDRFIAYKRRTIQHTKPNAELRVLTCIYHQENVNPILTLFEYSHPSPTSPICIYVLHLNQLVGRAATVLAPYKHNNNSSITTETDHIVNAFNYFAQQHQGCTSVLPHVCLSPYATMHEDICSLALEKKTSLVIVPFHKHLAIDGTIDTINPAIQNVNINVLHYAPCSVAILVSHALSTGSMFSIASGGAVHRIAVYFIGGPDDRESLAYGMRMAQNPSVGLTLVRFRPPKELREGGKEEKLDDAVVEEFRTGMVDGSRVVYREETVRDGEGTVEVIRTISSHFSLLIVGRRDGKESRLTEGLSEWNEYPELGIVGDLLASTDFGGRVSTLVVQQQTRFGSAGGGQVDSPKVQHKGQVVPNEFEDKSFVSLS